MGNYEKKTFRPFWGFWYFVAAADMFGAGWWGLQKALIAGLIWLGVFLIVEGWAAYRKTLDDTLSDFSAWLSAKVSVHPGSPFYERLASVLAAFLGVYAGWVISWGFSSIPLDIVAAIVAISIWFWLRDHFKWLVAKILAKKMTTGG